MRGIATVLLSLVVLLPCACVSIYPRNQAALRTPLGDFEPNALALLQDTFARLNRGELGVLPDPKRFAVVGHSVGELLGRAIVATEDWRLLPSENHGTPPLEGSRAVPTRANALGGGAHEPYMGMRSDGTPVKELIVVSTPRRGRSAHRHAE